MATATEAAVPVAVPDPALLGKIKDNLITRVDNKEVRLALRGEACDFFSCTRFTECYR